LPEPDELETIAKALAGDRSAFAAMVRATARLVYATLYLETGDPHRADDLVQETYLLAWRGRGQLTLPAGFRAWLVQIARRALLDSVKRDGRKKRAGKASDIPLTLLPGVGDEPPDAVGREESKANVLAALRELPDQYRLPLSLRYLAGCDYATIGRQLGLTNGALHGLLHRGLKQLRSKLESP
jgi:RNA polymerase sigma-70 factor (ECF subfamily)